MDLETRRKWGFQQALGTFSGSGTHTAKIPAKADSDGAVRYRPVVDGMYLSGDDVSSIRAQSGTISGPKLRCAANYSDSFGGIVQFADNESVDVVYSGVGDYWLNWHYES